MIKYLDWGNELKPGWYFWDETGQPIGPYKSKWDAEKMLSIYILHEKGVGDQKLLYGDLTKIVEGVKVWESI